MIRGRCCASDGGPVLPRPSKMSIAHRSTRKNAAACAANDHVRQGALALSGQVDAGRAARRGRGRPRRHCRRSPGARRTPAGLITSRTHPGLLGLSATLDPAGEALVEGDPWWHPRVEALVSEAAGPDAHLVPYDGPERFDILPLLVATDGAIAAFGRDGRRLRPNIVIGGVQGLAERHWEARGLVSAPPPSTCTRCASGAS